nr:MAG TPA: hypothetical protein [Caudoviricetes sp.]
MSRDTICRIRPAFSLLRLICKRLQLILWLHLRPQGLVTLISCD